MRSYPSLLLAALLAALPAAPAPAQTKYDARAVSVEGQPLIDVLAAKVPRTAKGQADGVASLDSAAKIPLAQIPVAADATGVAAGDDPRITGAVQRADNLADLASPATARGNLGLDTAATRPVTAFDPSGAAAIAEASAIAVSAQRSANLADLSDPATARLNLGLGDAATQPATAFDPAGAAANAIASSAQRAANLADVADPAAARTNLGLGSAATQAASAFDPAGAAANAQDAALSASVLRGSNLADVADPAVARSNLGLGSAATQPVTAFDPAGAASDARAAAIAASAQRDANLADLVNAGIARINLGLDTAATQPASAFDPAGAAAAAKSEAINASIQRASNLSDLANVETARTNLGLGSAATRPVSAFEPAGAAAYVLATAADSSVQRASNLADLASPAAARANLGLGDAATRGFGTSTGTVMAGDDPRVVVSRQFATLIDASAATIEPETTRIEIADRGAYAYSAGQPTDPDRVQSANGRWFARVYQPLAAITIGSAAGGSIEMLSNGIRIKQLDGGTVFQFSRNNFTNSPTDPESPGNFVNLVRRDGPLNVRAQGTAPTVDPGDGSDPFSISGASFLASSLGAPAAIRLHTDASADPDNPEPVTSGSILGAINISGTSSTFIDANGKERSRQWRSGFLQCVASENWSETAAGSMCSLGVTGIGATVSTRSLDFFADGIGSPTSKFWDWTSGLLKDRGINIGSAGFPVCNSAATGRRVAPANFMLGAVSVCDGTDWLSATPFARQVQWTGVVGTTQQSLVITSPSKLVPHSSASRSLDGFVAGVGATAAKTIRVDFYQASTATTTANIASIACGAGGQGAYQLCALTINAARTLALGDKLVFVPIGAADATLADVSGAVWFRGIQPN